MVNVHGVFELSHDLLTGGCMKEGEQGKGKLCETENKLSCHDTANLQIHMLSAIWVQPTS